MTPKITSHSYGIVMRLQKGNFEETLVSYDNKYLTFVVL